MGSDQSKSSEKHNSNSNFRDRKTSKISTATSKLSSYHLQNRQSERVQRAHNFTQDELLFKTEHLYPRLDQMTTSYYGTPQYGTNQRPNRTPASFANNESNTSTGAAQKTAYTAPAAQSSSSGCTPPRPYNPREEDFVLVNQSASQPQCAFPPTAPTLNQINCHHNNAACQNPRSRSRARPAPAATADAININCRTCGEQLTENIFQCSNGHSACEQCKNRSARCALCQQLVTDVRNFALQDYVGQIKTPCYYASEGCKLSFKIANMSQHLKKCPFQEMDCPLKVISGKCSWRGKQSQLTSHFDSNHPENRQGNVDQELVLPNIYYDDHGIHFVEIGCYKFLVHLRVSEAERRICMAVQLIGTMNAGSKWTYDLHVYNKREPRRKFQFSDSCHPINVPVAEIFREAKCAILPLPYALTFINEGALTYKFYIKRDDEGKELVPRGASAKRFNKKNKNNN